MPSRVSRDPSRYEVSGGQRASLLSAPPSSPASAQASVACGRVVLGVLRVFEEAPRMELGGGVRGGRLVRVHGGLSQRGPDCRR